MKVLGIGKEVDVADILFAIVLVLSLLMQNGYLSQLKTLPSPIYGGTITTGWEG